MSMTRHNSKTVALIKMGRVTVLLTVFQIPNRKSVCSHGGRAGCGEM